MLFQNSCFLSRFSPVKRLRFYFTGFLSNIFIKRSSPNTEYQLKTVLNRYHTFTIAARKADTCLSNKLTMRLRELFYLKLTSPSTRETNRLLRVPPGEQAITITEIISTGFILSKNEASQAVTETGKET